MKKFIEYAKQNGILHMTYTNEKGEDVFRTCAKFRGFTVTENNLWCNIELEDSWTIAKDLDEAFEMFKDFVANSLSLDELLDNEEFKQEVDSLVSPKPVDEGCQTGY